VTSEEMSNASSEVIMLLAGTYAIDPRVRNEAESLRDFGYKVTVLSWDRSGMQPMRASISGVDIVSFRLLRGQSFSKFRFAISALLFQFACFAWCMSSARTRQRTIHSHDFNTLPAAILLKLILHMTLIYDSHELTPAAFSEWYGPRIGAIVGAIEKSFLRFVDKIITVSPPIKNYLSSISNAPVFLIYNTIKLSDAPSKDKKWWRSLYGLDGHFVVSYVGGLREDTALESLIEAARECANQHSQEVRFIIVGDGSRLDSFRSQAVGTEEYLKFIPRVSHELALGYVKASDITFAVYKDLGENTRIAMPWKLFESMACGTPVLVREGTYTWRFVKSHRIGLSAGSGSAREISHQIIWALKNRDSLESVSIEGKKNFTSYFNWDSMSRVLLEVYKN
jgi:glycosyltransferase involved in cell wall biosynthesis